MCACPKSLLQTQIHLHSRMICVHFAQDITNPQINLFILAMHGRTGALYSPCWPFKGISPAAIGLPNIALDGGGFVLLSLQRICILIITPIWAEVERILFLHTINRFKGFDADFICTWWVIFFARFLRLS